MDLPDCHSGLWCRGNSLLHNRVRGSEPRLRVSGSLITPATDPTDSVPLTASRGVAQTDNVRFATSQRGS